MVFIVSAPLVITGSPPGCGRAGGGCRRQLLFTAGFSRTSMDDLAQELRISKKTIYRYFPLSRIGAPQLLWGRGDPILRSHVALERLLTSELPLALDRSAADLLRETVDVVLRGALVPDGGTSGPGDRSSAPGTSKTPRRPT
jgi:hypothetical protein